MSNLLTSEDGRLGPLGILFVVFLVVVGALVMLGMFMFVRQRLLESRSSKSAGQNGLIIIDEETGGKTFMTQNESKPIPEPMAAYFPVQYRHQMDTEMYTSPPPPRRQHKQHKLQAHGRKSRRVL